MQKNYYLILINIKNNKNKKIIEIEKDLTRNEKELYYIYLGENPHNQCNLKVEKRTTNGKPIWKIIEIISIGSEKSLKEIFPNEKVFREKKE